MIVKAPLFRALLLLCELKCWILACALPMRAKALQKLEGGLYEVQWKCVFFPQYSANFLNKRQVWFEMFCRSVFGSERMGSFLKIPFGILKKKKNQDKYYARILRKHASVAVLQEQTTAPLNKARLFYGSFPLLRHSPPLILWLCLPLIFSLVMHLMFPICRHHRKTPQEAINSFLIPNN